MELDELKKSWESIGKTEKRLEEKEIKAFVQNSSHSPLVKIRKNMMSELISIFVILLGLYAFVFLKKDPSNLLYIGLGILTAISLLLLLIVFPRLYAHTKRHHLNKSVSYNLSENIIELKNDLDFYEKFMLFLYVPACLAGFALSDYLHPAIVILFVLFFPLYYLLVKKWVKFFYGQYVTELQEMANELEE